MKKQKERKQTRQTLIIPDTNFLIYITKYKIWYDFERDYSNQSNQQYKILILPEVIYELEKLNKKSKKGKNKEYALLSIELIRKLKNIEIKKYENKGNYKRNYKNYGDKAILEEAKAAEKLTKKLIVATMDKLLIKKLKKQNPHIKILTIRKKKYLMEK